MTFIESILEGDRQAPRKAAAHGASYLAADPG
jgi:hypothetical protein